MTGCDVPSLRIQLMDEKRMSPADDSMAEVSALNSVHCFDIL